MPVGLVVASSHSRVKLDHLGWNKPQPSGYDTNNQSLVSLITYHKSLPIPQAGDVEEDSEPPSTIAASSAWRPSELHSGQRATNVPRSVL